MGSEMCIRDRAGYEHDLLAARSAAILARSGIQSTAALNQAEPGACLLYTSDAADDLLCVDLGGRRIIKKKRSYTRSRNQKTRELLGVTSNAVR